MERPVLNDRLSASPQSSRDSLSSLSDLPYFGKNYVDLIDMIKEISNDERERKAAEKSERQFVEWKWFTIFMKRLEQLDATIEEELQGAGFPANKIISVCDFIIHECATPSTTNFDGYASLIATKPRNILTIMRVKKYVIEEIASQTNLKTHEVEEYIYDNLIPHHRLFGRYLCRVIRVIVVSWKVLQTSPLDGLQEEALESLRREAVKHTDRAEVYPRTPAELYRYKMKLLSSLGRAAKAFIAEEKAESEQGWLDAIDSTPCDDGENSVTEEGEEREDQPSELAPVAAAPAPGFVPPIFPNFLHSYFT